jgi:hypothetical protein
MLQDFAVFPLALAVDSHAEGGNNILLTWPIVLLFIYKTKAY